MKFRRRPVWAHRPRFSNQLQIEAGSYDLPTSKLRTPPSCGVPQHEYPSRLMLLDMLLETATMRTCLQLTPAGHMANHERANLSCGEFDTMVVRRTKHRPGSRLKNNYPSAAFSSPLAVDMFETPAGQQPRTCIVHTMARAGSHVILAAGFHASLASDAVGSSTPSPLNCRRMRS